MKPKLLFITEHLSTGGQPQYLLKQIESFLDQFNIQVIEYNDWSGNDFVVQKNRIKDIVKLHTLGNNKGVVNSIIRQFEPDIIHFQEIPDSFISEPILDYMFRERHPYSTVVTAHGSDKDPTKMKYYPDRFACVSKWQLDKFSPTGVECGLWEYPIEYKKVDDQEKKGAILKLHFVTPIGGKNILNVGLFTPGKNQGEIFDIARSLPHYNFHFVGNQAGNFKDYWGPLMADKPDNCIVWGERDDVDLFYQACDAVYFASKWELMPLALKEAIGYGLPTLCYNLPTYSGEFDSPNTHYINDLSRSQKIHLLENLWQEQKPKRKAHTKVLKSAQ